MTSASSSGSATNSVPTISTNSSAARTYVTSLASGSLASANSIDNSGTREHNPGSDQVANNSDCSTWSVSGTARHGGKRARRAASCATERLSSSSESSHSSSRLAVIVFEGDHQPPSSNTRSKKRLVEARTTSFFTEVPVAAKNKLKAESIIQEKFSPELQGPSTAQKSAILGTGDKKRRHKRSLSANPNGYPAITTKVFSKSSSGLGRPSTQRGSSKESYSYETSHSKKIKYDDQLVLHIVSDPNNSNLCNSFSVKSPDSTAPVVVIDLFTSPDGKLIPRSNISEPNRNNEVSSVDNTAGLADCFQAMANPNEPPHGRHSRSRGTRGQRGRGRGDANFSTDQGAHRGRGQEVSTRRVFRHSMRASHYRGRQEVQAFQPRINRQLSPAQFQDVYGAGSSNIHSFRVRGTNYPSSAATYNFGNRQRLPGNSSFNESFNSNAASRGSNNANRRFGSPHALQSISRHMCSRGEGNHSSHHSHGEPLSNASPVASNAQTFTLPLELLQSTNETNNAAARDQQAQLPEVTMTPVSRTGTVPQGELPRTSSNMVFNPNARAFYPRANFRDSTNSVLQDFGGAPVPSIPRRYYSTIPRNIGRGQPTAAGSHIPVLQINYASDFPQQLPPGQMNLFNYQRNNSELNASTSNQYYAMPYVQGYGGSTTVLFRNQRVTLNVSPHQYMEFVSTAPSAATYHEFCLANMDDESLYFLDENNRTFDNLDEDDQMDPNNADRDALFYIRSLHPDTTDQLLLNLRPFIRENNDIVPVILAPLPDIIDSYIKNLTNEDYIHLMQHNELHKLTPFMSAELKRRLDEFVPLYVEEMAASNPPSETEQFQPPNPHPLTHGFSGSRSREDERGNNIPAAVVSPLFSEASNNYSFDSPGYLTRTPVLTADEQLEDYTGLIFDDAEESSPSENLSQENHSHLGLDSFLTFANFDANSASVNPFEASDSGTNTEQSPTTSNVPASDNLQVPVEILVDSDVIPLEVTLQEMPDDFSQPIGGGI